MQTKALKLFVVKDSSGVPIKGDDGRPLYFSDKMVAKAARNTMEGQTLSFGPDHRKFNGDLT